LNLEEGIVHEDCIDLSGGLDMDLKKRGTPRRGSDLLILELIRFHKTLIKILNGEYQSFSEHLFELKKLKNALGRREHDRKNFMEILSTLEAIAQRISEIYSRKPRKVNLKKIEGKIESIFPAGSIRTGWEESRPAVGKRYYIYLDKGTIFRTGIVKRISDDMIYTNNSIYSIEVIEEK